MKGNAGKKAIVAGIVVVLLAFVAAWAFLLSSLLGGGSADRAQVARSVALALETLPSDPQSRMAASSARSIDGTASQAVPEGTKIKPVTGTWSPEPSGGGTMLVEVSYPGGEQASLVAVMMKEDDQWKVLATFPAEEAADSE